MTHTLNEEAACLIRVSTQQQEFESQIAAIRVEALRLGFTIPDHLIFGEKITGMDDPEKKDRESIEQLKRAVADSTVARGIRAIFIWEISRLSRNQAVLFNNIAWFSRRKKPICFISHNNVWTMNPNTLQDDEAGLMLITILSRYGEQERNKIIQRNKRGKDHAVEQERFVGGHVPFGYHVKAVGNKKYYAVDKHTAPVVQDIFDKYCAGWSGKKITKHLNMTGIPPYHAGRLNNKWRHATVIQLLKNEFYTGIRRYNDKVLNCPAIITSEQFATTQEMMKTNTCPSAKIRKFHYLLKPYLVCGRCGEKFYGQATHARQVYFCRSQIPELSGCQQNKFNKYKAEAAVWTAVKSTPHIIDIYEEERNNSIGAQELTKMKTHKKMLLHHSVELNKRKQDILKLVASGSFTFNDAERIENELNLEIQDNCNELKRAEADIKLLEHQLNSTDFYRIRDEIQTTKDIHVIQCILDRLIYKIVAYSPTPDYTLLQLIFNNPTHFRLNVLTYRHDRTNRFWFFTDSENTYDPERNQIVAHGNGAGFSIPEFSKSTDSQPYNLIETNPFLIENISEEQAKIKRAKTKVATQRRTEQRRNKKNRFL
ncbi:MAG: recombinase family protein [Bacteroidales bacterium]|jgi:DNA invertase Pin-like site-specific DNA recombinase|nr:recombinase family protein [Bacteroidales bacterium]